MTRTPLKRLREFDYVDWHSSSGQSLIQGRWFEIEIAGEDEVIVADWNKRKRGNGLVKLKRYNPNPICFF